MNDFLRAEEILQERRDQKEKQKGKADNWVVIFGYDYDKDTEDYSSWSYYYFENRDDAENFEDVKITNLFGAYNFKQPEKKVILPYEVYKQNSEMLLDDLEDLQ